MKNNQILNSLIYFLNILILSFIMTGCLKKDPPFYKISEKNKNFGFFKKGSYWIYFNPYLNASDSIFVDSTLYSIYEDIPDIKKGNVSSKTEIIGTACKNSNELRILNFKLNGYYDNLTILEGDLSNKLSWFLCFFNEPPNYDGFTKNLSVENINTIKISNFNFSNVIYQKSTVLTVNSQSVPEIQTTDTVEYWIAKNVGIIKKIVKNNYKKEEWDLIRYKVLQ